MKFNPRDFLFVFLPGNNPAPQKVFQGQPVFIPYTSGTRSANDEIYQPPRSKA